MSVGLDWRVNRSGASTGAARDAPLEGILPHWGGDLLPVDHTIQETFT